MAEYTPNLKLNKQQGNDFYDIGIVNENLDKIDAAIGNIKVSPEDIGAAKKSDLDAHVTDGTKHITAAERNAWNVKETPEGAQAKANAAEQNAKNASLPRTGGTITGDLSVTNTLYAAGRNVIAELDSVKQSGNSAKQGTVDAIISKGISASMTDEWSTLHTKIRQIPVGIRTLTSLVTNVDTNAQTRYIVHQIQPSTKVFTSTTTEWTGYLGNGGGACALQLEDANGLFIDMFTVDSGFDGTPPFCQTGLVLDKTTRTITWTYFYGKGTSGNNASVLSQSGVIPNNFDLTRRVVIHHYVKGGSYFYTKYSFKSMDMEI